jgi:hypothetical protein
MSAPGSQSAREPATQRFVAPSWRHFPIPAVSGDWRPTRRAESRRRSAGPAQTHLAIKRYLLLKGELTAKDIVPMTVASPGKKKNMKKYVNHAHNIANQKGDGMDPTRGWLTVRPLRVLPCAAEAEGGCSSYGQTEPVALITLRPIQAHTQHERLNETFKHEGQKGPLSASSQAPSSA